MTFGHIPDCLPDVRYYEDPRMDKFIRSFGVRPLGGILLQMKELYLPFMVIVPGHVECLLKGMESVATLPLMTSIVLPGIDGSCEGMTKLIEALSYKCPNLRTLNLSHANMDAQAIRALGAALASGRWGRLANLYLAGGAAEELMDVLGMEVMKALDAGGLDFVSHLSLRGRGRGLSKNVVREFAGVLNRLPGLSFLKVDLGALANANFLRALDRVQASQQVHR